MIAIISEEYDKTTDLVIDWLNNLKGNFSRFNSSRQTTLSIKISNKEHFNFSFSERFELI
jgi:hypothetical protein